MSDLANSQIRVGVDTFSGISELRSSGACFPSSSAVLQISADWLGGFQLRRFGRDKVAGEAARSISRTSPGAKNKSCVLGHVVGVA